MARNNTDTSVNIRETPMQKTTNKIMMIATEWHGLTRTTSVNIREAPMQKNNKQNNDSNGMARSNTALSLKGVNNKFNKLHEFTKQDHERKRSANGTNLTTSTYRISVLNSFHLVNAGVH